MAEQVSRDTQTSLADRIILDGIRRDRGDGRNGDCINYTPSNSMCKAYSWKVKLNSDCIGCDKYMERK